MIMMMANLTNGLERYGKKRTIFFTNIVYKITNLNNYVACMCVRFYFTYMTSLTITYLTLIRFSIVSGFVRTQTTLTLPTAP